MSEDVSFSSLKLLFNQLFPQGKIGPRELRKAFKTLGEIVSEEEILAMVRKNSVKFFYIFLNFQIEEFDQDGDGKIDMNEFIDLMMNDEF